MINDVNEGIDLLKSFRTSVITNDSAVINPEDDGEVDFSSELKDDGFFSNFHKRLTSGDSIPATNLIEVALQYLEI
jgi:hypothetical protein